MYNQYWRDHTALVTAVLAPSVQRLLRVLSDLLLIHYSDDWLGVLQWVVPISPRQC